MKRAPILPGTTEDVIWTQVCLTGVTPHPENFPIPMQVYPHEHSTKQNDLSLYLPEHIANETVRRVVSTVFL